jgi:hypothetical protein
VRIAFLCLAAFLAWAPLQCSHDPDPSLRREETPGEALYGLATQFKAKGETQAWRSTLEYLIARYPNSRFAVTAKDDLAKADKTP